MSQHRVSHSSLKMTSKLLVFLAFSACLHFIAATEAETAQHDKTEHETLDNEESKLSAAPAGSEISGGSRKKCFIPTAAGRQRTIGMRIRQAEENGKNVNLQLAIETTKLAELEKQKEAEQISDTTPVSQLKPYQRNILNEIAITKAKKEDSTVDSAVSKTLVEELKKIIAANGGSQDASSNTNPIQIQTRLNLQIRQAQRNQQRVDAELATETSQLEVLERRKTDQNINTDSGTSSLTSAQRLLLLQIDRSKERKYRLTTQSAVMKTMVEQLQLQLDEASGTGTSNSGSTSSAAASPAAASPAATSPAAASPAAASTAAATPAADSPAAASPAAASPASEGTASSGST